MNDPLSNFATIMDVDGRLLARQGYYIDNYLFLTDISGQQMLDIGGGNGFLGLYNLIVRGISSISIVDSYDSHGGKGGHESAYDHLMGIIQRHKIKNIDVIKSDIRDVKLSSGKYDSVYARNAFHHIFTHGRTKDSDIVEFMQSIRESLVPGGSLIIGESSRNQVWRFIPPIRKRMANGRWIQNLIAPGRWRRCATSAGFKTVDLRWYTPYRLRWLKPILSNQVANAFMTGSYVLELRK
ncbi:MAG TPA: class I SAM-dependent methyltransferase [Gammaproteobacteria bacterium]|nr:class I SAM-dependent methyltransferase [Gammaproteobacteria bacterium]